MLRLVHSQTVSGAILVDDIDDGLPNKVVHRLGSNADPKSYDRDTAAGVPKQPCYVPRTQASDGFPTIPGYINLLETQRVVYSAGKGKISKMSDSGLISVVSLVESDIAAPTLTTAVHDDPGAGDLTLTGTNFLSVSPDITSVILTGTGAVTLTAADITGGGGTVGATSIVIPAALVPGTAETVTSAQVQANEQVTAVVVLTAAPPP